MSKRVTLFLSLVVAMLFGVLLGLYAQSNSATRLAKLSEEKAEISKMDLVLLNTRVEVLLQMLKDDLELPFTPTAFRYDADKKKIRIAVHVALAFLAEASSNQISKTLQARATTLCVAPELADGNLAYMFPIQPPQEYCAIRFFTEALSRTGDVQTNSEVASFEDGKLILK